MKTHQDTGTRLHNMWMHMNARGNCNLWKNNFLLFKTWALEHSYNDTVRIERIDKKEKYSPSNCKFSLIAVHPIAHNSTSRLYSIWKGMIRRCKKENYKNFHNYGGRGIHVCEAWKHYPNFMSWALVNGYRDDLTIDRTNNNEGYSPENCRWVTLGENLNNTRRNRLHAEWGETKTLTDWARDKRSMVNKNTLFDRLADGIPFVVALTTKRMPTPIRKLTVQQVSEIRTLLQEKRYTKTTIAKKYGVSKALIGQISFNKRWRQ